MSPLILSLVSFSYLSTTHTPFFRSSFFCDSSSIYPSFENLFVFSPARAKDHHLFGGLSAQTFSTETEEGRGSTSNRLSPGDSLGPAFKRCESLVHSENLFVPTWIRQTTGERKREKMKKQKGSKLELNMNDKRKEKKESTRQNEVSNLNSQLKERRKTSNLSKKSLKHQSTFHHSLIKRERLLHLTCYRSDIIFYHQCH